MSVNKTLEQLKTILTGEQFDAFTVSIGSLIETKVAERSAQLLEEQLVVFKAKIQIEAERWLNLAVEEKQHEFGKLLEEARAEYETRLVGELATIESRIVGGLDKLLEEEVEAVLPNDIRLMAAQAQVYGGIVKGTIAVLEEQSHIISPNKVVARVLEEQRVLQEELGETRAKLAESQTAVNMARANSATTEKKLSKENSRLRTQLFLEHKTADLSEKEKAGVLAMFVGSTFEDVKARIDNTIELLEESRGAVRRKAARVTERQHDGDAHPGVSMNSKDSGETLIEEERQRAKDSTVSHSQRNTDNDDILTTGSSNFMAAIDGFLD